MFHLSLTSHRVRLHKAGRGGQSLVLMVRLQRKQTSTGDVRQREERGEGSMLEEGDGAGAAGREGSRSGFAQRVAEGGAGGEQRAGWELLQQHLHPQTSPQFSNHESQGAICDMCRECGATC